MRPYEIKELIHWLEEIKTQAAGPTCRNLIQTGIDFYKTKEAKAR